MLISWREALLPLEWSYHKDEDGEEFARAETPFGSYSVERRDGYGWRWGYCFDEHYDEDDFACDDLEDGKRLAWENWMERMSGAFPAEPGPPHQQGLKQEEIGE